MCFASVAPYGASKAACGSVNGAVPARQESSCGGCQMLPAAVSIGANPLLLNEEIERCLK